MTPPNPDQPKKRNQLGFQGLKLMGNHPNPDQPRKCDYSNCEREASVFDTYIPNGEKFDLCVKHSEDLDSVIFDFFHSRSSI